MYHRIPFPLTPYFFLPLPMKEKGGDILDPALAKSQVDLVARMRKIGSSIIVVYFGGRPRLLGSVGE